VATLGTTGTLMGVSRKLKECDPSIQIVGVEPYLGHKIQGLKNMKESYLPEIFDKSSPHQIFNVSFWEWEKIPRLPAKTSVGLRYEELSQRITFGL
jgi:cysteinyl-tRNA synthetase